jgi:hypothetical protein
MATAEGFPPELLSQPPTARLAYFAGKVVAHPRLKEAHQAVLKAIRQPADRCLILVFGPTGVGKTTLRLRLEKQLMEETWPDLERDPGRIPVVGLEAVAAESGQFSWKDYYTRALLALDEPLLAHKIDPHSAQLRRDRTGSQAVPALRRALEQALRYRRPAAVIVDEAQHLRKMASGRRLLDQMDTLKSLAGMSGAIHVLVGTYELLSLANLSAQLSRRSVDIHFGRYQADQAEDWRAFQSVLLTFQRHLPLPTEPDLVGRAEYLYEHSVGCIGVLKSWLVRALAGALEEGASSLTPHHLERQADPTRKRLSLAREIHEGEAALCEGDTDQGEVRRLLGLASAPVLGGGNGSGRTPRRESGSSRPMGQRRPVRDPVGEAGSRQDAD